MCDSVKPQHLHSLTEDEIASLDDACARRPHLTPRERQLAVALRAIERGHLLRIKSKRKAERS